MSLQLGMKADQLQRFDEASNHPYECRCELCKEWWAQVPPEEDEDDSPFCQCGAVHGIEESDSNCCDSCGKEIEP